uniref:Uncharacterized protein n=1 Tax=Palpitomonas bilix TaxID=652834 RepID=A0A7S3LV12_9EUKA|mmetsp:Transcript_481/g.950  ORF Transcript_481/g.950 Transcript_481/m.950 type:complete len:184 (+) Transcript_481:91-642(+)
MGSRKPKDSWWSRSGYQLLLEKGPDLPTTQSRKEKVSPSLIFLFYIALSCGIGYGWGCLLFFLFENVYCDILFCCGCTWDWDGGWDHCNVHVPGLPHCPWCAATYPAVLATRLDWTTAAVYVAYFIFVQGKMISRLFWSAFWGFFVYGLVCAYAFKVATNYPFFLCILFGKDNSTDLKLTPTG